MKKVTERLANMKKATQRSMRKCHTALSALLFLSGVGFMSVGFMGVGFMAPGAQALEYPNVTPFAYADEPTVTIIDLNNASPEMDGTRVSFIGEAIGDIISAENGNVWVTFSENNSYNGYGSTRENNDTPARSVEVTYSNASISVYMTSADAVKITNLGRYHVVGTILKIDGVFNLACDMHEGQSDVHAVSVQVIDPGGSVPQNPDYSLLIFGGILICVGSALIFLFRVLRERQR